MDHPRLDTEVVLPSDCVLQDAESHLAERRRREILRFVAVMASSESELPPPPDILF